MIYLHVCMYVCKYAVSSNTLQCHNIKNILQWNQVQWNNDLIYNTRVCLYFVYIVHFGLSLVCVIMLLPRAVPFLVFAAVPRTAPPLSTATPTTVNT